MTASQVAERIILMCVSAAGLCTAGLLWPPPGAAYYLCEFGGLVLGWGASFAVTLYQAERRRR